MEIGNSLTDWRLNSFPNMRKQRPKRPCARAWVYSFEEIVVLASSAKMAPPANVALLRVKLAEVTSDMSTCVCVEGGGRGTCRKGYRWAGCMWWRVYVVVGGGVCGFRLYIQRVVRRKDKRDNKQTTL